jgi:hypothetical protein
MPELLTPALFQWLATTLFILVGGSIRFRSFRAPAAWMVLLGLGIAVGLLAPLGFSFSQGPVLRALRFQIIPYALLAACIGYVLRRERAW